jgi:hypothetical protein
MHWLLVDAHALHRRIKTTVRKVREGGEKLKEKEVRSSCSLPQPAAHLSRCCCAQRMARKAADRVLQRRQAKFAAVGHAHALVPKCFRGVAI